MPRDSKEWGSQRKLASVGGNAMVEKILDIIGARLIAQGVDGGRKVAHYMLPDGRVLEIIG